ncbi:FMN-dependent NADH-azoreductase [Aquamicrobium terrae]
MNQTLLHLTVSPRKTESYSRRYGQELVQSLCHANPGLQPTIRDLTSPVLPLPDEGFVEASLKPADQHTEKDKSALALSEQLIAELSAASSVVIDTPMHNFTVPASLKAWVDYIVRPNRTFKNTGSGKVGLLSNRPVFLIVACGGPVSEAAGAQTDHLTPYLRYVFQTIGITDFRSKTLDRMRRDPQRVKQADLEALQWTRQHRLLSNQVAG